jgi:hypothetical protein
MKQNEIVEPVAAAVDPPDDMVCVPVGLSSNHLTAGGASAFLSPPRPERAIFIRRSSRCSKYSSHWGSKGFASALTLTWRMIEVLPSRYSSNHSRFFSFSLAANHHLRPGSAMKYRLINKPTPLLECRRFAQRHSAFQIGWSICNRGTAIARTIEAGGAPIRQFELCDHPRQVLTVTPVGSLTCAREGA